MVETDCYFPPNSSLILYSSYSSPLPSISIYPPYQPFPNFERGKLRWDTITFPFTMMSIEHQTTTNKNQESAISGLSENNPLVSQKHDHISVFLSFLVHVPITQEGHECKSGLQHEVLHDCLPCGLYWLRSGSTGRFSSQQSMLLHNKPIFY